MSGDHRGPAENPVMAALKSIRWLVPLIALVAAVPAVLGLIIYLLVIATNLERLGCNCLLAAGVFIQAVARRPRGPAHLGWLVTSWLLVATWNLFTAFAQQRRWPPGQLHSLTLTGYGVSSVAAVVLGVALVLDIRAGGFGQRWAASRTKGQSPGQ
jgi:hypothetical protein